MPEMNPEVSLYTTAWGSHGICAQTILGLPPVPDFSDLSHASQPRDEKCPGFQGKVKMTR